MARLPSSTVAQTLVKGLQVASPQGAIREVFLLWLVNLPPPTNPPSVLNQVFIKGLLTNGFP